MPPSVAPACGGDPHDCSVVLTAMEEGGLATFAAAAAAGAAARNDEGRRRYCGNDGDDDRAVCLSPGPAIANLGSIEVESVCSYTTSSSSRSLVTMSSTDAARSPPSSTSSFRRLARNFRSTSRGPQSFRRYAGGDDPQVGDDVVVIRTARERITCVPIAQGVDRDPTTRGGGGGGASRRSNTATTTTTAAGSTTSSTSTTTTTAASSWQGLDDTDPEEVDRRRKLLIDSLLQDMEEHDILEDDPTDEESSSSSSSDDSSLTDDAATGPASGSDNKGGGGGASPSALERALSTAACLDACVAAAYETASPLVGCGSACYGAGRPAPPAPPKPILRNRRGGVTAGNKKRTTCWDAAVRDDAGQSGGCDATAADAGVDESKTTDGTAVPLLSKSITDSRVVSFSRLEIHEFDMTLGDHPSAVSGPPLMLDWERGERECHNVTLDDYESTRQPRRRRKQLKISYRDRKAMLLDKANGHGFTEEQINEAWAEAMRIRRQRKETLNRGLILMLCDEVWESAARKYQRFMEYIGVY